MIQLQCHFIKVKMKPGICTSEYLIKVFVIKGFLCTRGKSVQNLRWKNTFGCLSKGRRPLLLFCIKDRMEKMQEKEGEITEN